MRKVHLYIFLTVSVLFIPFVFSNDTIDPVSIPRFLALAILLFVMLLISIKKRANIDSSVLKRLIFILLFAYFTFSAISLIGATNVVDGLFELMKIFLSIVFLYLATILIGTKKTSIDILVKVFIISTLLISMVGICQYYNLAFMSIPGAEHFTPYSTMVNKNLFASFLLLSLPFASYGALYYTGYWSTLSISSFMVSFFNIIITNSRAVWIGLIFSTLICIVILGVFFRRLNITDLRGSLYIKRFLKFPLCLIVIIILAKSIDTPVKPFYLVDVQPETAISSVNERLHLWTKSLQMLKDNLIFGAGVGNWKTLIPKYGTQGLRFGAEVGLVHFQRPHNDFLWVFAEIGILGFICYLLIFCTAIGYILKIIIGPASSHEKILSILMLFGLTSFIMVSFFSFLKERIVHSMLLMFILACVISIHHRHIPIQTKKTLNLNVLLFAIPSLLFLIFSMFIGYIRLNSEIHARHALMAYEANNWEAVIYEVDKAESQFYIMDPMSTPLTWYSGVAQFTLNNIEAAFRDFKRAQEVHPNHLHVLNNLATCYELLGDHDNAIHYYKKVLSISPNFEEAIINLAAVYFNIGKYNEAYETLRLCNPKSENPKLSKYLRIVKERVKE